MLPLIPTALKLTSKSHIAICAKDVGFYSNTNDGDSWTFIITSRMEGSSCPTMITSTVT